MSIRTETISNRWAVGSSAADGGCSYRHLVRGKRRKGKEEKGIRDGGMVYAWQQTKGLELFGILEGGSGGGREKKQTSSLAGKVTTNRENERFPNTSRLGWPYPHTEDLHRYVDSKGTSTRPAKLLAFDLQFHTD